MISSNKSPEQVILGARANYTTKNNGLQMSRDANALHIETDLGTISISPTTIASVAAHAVLETYGVVGMALPSLRDGIAELLQRDHSKRGVVVRTESESITVDLYVVLEYGLRVSEIAHNIMSNVKFSIEKIIGVPASHVNVHVQALRTSSLDEETAAEREEHASD